MKKYLMVYYGDAPECVEGFSKECKRSCKGALHVNPGRQMTVTEGELEYIKGHKKHMLAKLRVISELVEKKPEPVKAKVEPKKETAKVEKAVEEKPEAHEGKKKRRR